MNLSDERLNVGDGILEDGVEGCRACRGVDATRCDGNVHNASL